MNNICSCESGKINLVNDGIFFITDFKNGCYELECAFCSEKINISEEIYKRYDNLYSIDIREFVFNKSFYKEELKYIINLLTSSDETDFRYKEVYEILTYIIYFYNKEYYELFYMYEFNIIRGILVNLVMEKYNSSNTGYESYEKLIKDVMNKLKDVPSSFNMVRFLNLNSSKNIYVYGPCVFLEEIDGNPNKKFMQKYEYKENELEINLEIMSLQLENSEMIERYIINCYKSNLLSDNFIDLLYKYKKDKRHSFYKSFLHCMSEEHENEFLSSDEVVIIGLKIALAEVLEVGYIDINDITFENYKEILRKQKNNKEIIKKFLSKE